jgi:uncharacterized membrane protein YfcA
MMVLKIIFTLLFLGIAIQCMYLKEKAISNREERAWRNASWGWIFAFSFSFVGLFAPS